MSTTRGKDTPSRWMKVAVDYYRNPKIITVGVYGEVAFLRLLAIARERIEIADQDGEVPYALANRELRDIAEAWGDGTTDDLLAVLTKSRLISVKNDNILITDYSKWQTTREEIASKRESARLRAASSRAARNGTRKATSRK